MKKIKIKISNFNPEVQLSFSYFIYQSLKKYYDVEFSENPDYLFYHESSYEHVQYNCVKIFYTGENISPNFNLCDYGISFDYMQFEDRSFRMPVYLVAAFYNQKDIELAGGQIDFSQQGVFTKEDLAKKTEFCSFVYSNYLAEESRQEIFDALSAYKKVNSGGGYLNNVGGRVASKFEFESKHKFSIAFENSSRLGYTTEKIVCSLAANTIPIYWGNTAIGREFNEKRFINCHDYKSFAEVVERVKEIDANDELYLRIINQPILAAGYDFRKIKQDFEIFLQHIIDQPLPLAKRRTINPVRARELEKMEAFAATYITLSNKIKKILSKMYKPFKSLQFLEELKFKFFQKTKR
jgi:hypothetical protein